MRMVFERKAWRYGRASMSASAFSAGFIFRDRRL
jgi:hypothetical protein